MSKFMYNGKPYGGSTNYASSVACTDAEGNESTVQAEIDKNRDDIDELNKKTVGKVIPKNNVTTTYNNNRIKKINNVVFCNISLTTLKEIYVTEHIADIPTEFKMSKEFGTGINVPLYDVDCKKVGNLWVSVSGAISYYSDTGTGSIPKSKNIYANFSYMT